MAKVKKAMVRAKAAGPTKAGLVYENQRLRQRVADLERGNAYMTKHVEALQSRCTDDELRVQNIQLEKECSLLREELRAEKVRGRLSEPAPVDEHAVDKDSVIEDLAFTVRLLATKVPG